MTKINKKTIEHKVIEPLHKYLREISKISGNKMTSFSHRRGMNRIYKKGICEKIEYNGTHTIEITIKINGGAIDKEEK